MAERAVITSNESAFIRSFRAARRVSTPIIAVQTPDPAATIRDIAKTTNGAAIISWDIVCGIRSFNDVGEAVVQNLSEPAMITNPTEALLSAVGFPSKTVFFFYNAQLFLDNASVLQGIWNLRDQYKQDQRTIVLLTPTVKLPAELAQDVLVLDEPLPTSEELCGIVKLTFKNAELEPPEPAQLEKAVEALSGLSAFTAEQATAMSLTKEGLDLPNLWERKRQTIEQAPGLSVWRGGETFDDIGGVENAKTFLRKVVSGNAPPNTILFIDEIEKALAGAGGDLSGTSQEMLGTLLSWMQDNAVTGIIAIGPPGAAKSMIAKATGATAGVPTITFDLSGMKGSLVGESGKNLRNALKVVDAVSDKKVLCIATCNSIGALPPELRRRFTFGTFFFDLPTAEERTAIWTLYLNKYKLLGPALVHDTYEVELPNDQGWTGAEIRQCCDLAYRLRITLKEASEFVVPVARSSAEQIEKLRTQASGRFISASKPGIYVYEKDRQQPTRRKLEVE